MIFSVGGGNALPLCCLKPRNIERRRLQRTTIRPKRARNASLDTDRTPYLNSPRPSKTPPIHICAYNGEEPSRDRTPANAEKLQKNRAVRSPELHPHCPLTGVHAC